MARHRQQFLQFLVPIPPKTRPAPPPLSESREEGTTLPKAEWTKIVAVHVAEDGGGVKIDTVTTMCLVLEVEEEEEEERAEV